MEKLEGNRKKWQGKSGGDWFSPPAHPPSGAVSDWNITLTNILQKSIAVLCNEGSTSGPMKNIAYTGPLHTQKNLTCLIILNIMLDHGLADQLNQCWYHAWSWLTVHQPLFMLDASYLIKVVTSSLIKHDVSILIRHYIKHEQWLMKCQP